MLGTAILCPRNISSCCSGMREDSKCPVSSRHHIPIKGPMSWAGAHHHLQSPSPGQPWTCFAGAAYLSIMPVRCFRKESKISSCGQSGLCVTPQGNGTLGTYSGLLHTPKVPQRGKVRHPASKVFVKLDQCAQCCLSCLNMPERH